VGRAQGPGSGEISLDFPDEVSYDDLPGEDQGAPLWPFLMVGLALAAIIGMAARTSASGSARSHHDDDPHGHHISRWQSSSSHTMTGSSHTMTGESHSSSSSPPSSDFGGGSSSGGGASGNW
jgi:uncharacterized membrane protein YgcG